MMLSSSIVAVKFLLISSGIVSVIVAMNYTLIQLPTIWSIMLLLFKPPYVYVVINGIIVTIAVTSRYTHTDTSPIMQAVENHRREIEISHGFDVAEDEREVVVLEEEVVLDVKKAVVVNGVEVAESFEKEREYDIALTVIEELLETPRCGNRKPPKASRQGGGKRTPSVNMEMTETLENTWKMITEGHQKEQRQDDAQIMSMVSCNDEPPHDEDDLHNRIEEFIKKFNEEMKLQRQKSLEQYMEMMNRETYRYNN